MGRREGIARSREERGGCLSGVFRVVEEKGERVEGPSEGESKGRKELGRERRGTMGECQVMFAQLALAPCHLTRHLLWTSMHIRDVGKVRADYR